MVPFVHGLYTTNVDGVLFLKGCVKPTLAEFRIVSSTISTTVVGRRNLRKLKRQNQTPPSTTAVELCVYAFLAANRSATELTIAPPFDQRRETKPATKMICIGPCCIPVSALAPLLLLLLSPVMKLLRMTPLGRLRFSDRYRSARTNSCAGL